MPQRESETKQVRFTLKGLFAESWKHMNLEKGFLLTSRELFLKPGLTIRTILDGKRESLTEPFRFLIVSVATTTVAMALLAPMTNNDGLKPALIEEAETEATKTLQTRVDELEQISEDQNQSREVRFRAKQARRALETSFGDWSHRAQAPWSNVVLLIAVPVYALCTRFVIGRNLNLAEHFVMNAYIYGVQCILATVVMVPLMLAGQFGLATTLYFAISLVYQIVAWNGTLRFRSVLDWAKCGFLVVITLVIYVVLGTVFVQAIIYAQLMLE